MPARKKPLAKIQPMVADAPLASAPEALASFLPDALPLLDNPQTALPGIAKDRPVVARIEEAVRRVPTSHTLCLMDSRKPWGIADESAHLILTSPPYWTLKEYRDTDGQLGHIQGYEEFLDQLDRVWRQAFAALIPGGRLVCVVGDVCLSRRRNGGRHTVVPLHSSIQERCRAIGYDNLAPIIWYKIANAKYEVEGGSGFLGKPYEPNAVIKNDIEFILMLRKPGGYRTPSLTERVLSVISSDNYQQWFQQIWSGLTGASTRNHPAPFPLELAVRLVRMFSFVGDTVVDPFMGTGTTNLAAATWGRNSIGLEIDAHYFALARTRMEGASADLFGATSIEVVDVTPPKTLKVAGGGHHLGKSG